MGLVLALTVGGCGDDPYEYGEKKIETSQAPVPSRTMDEVRRAGAGSDAEPQAQMGAGIPLPDGLPAGLPMPTEAWSASVVVAHPGWFDVSLVLLDPPGPLDQVLRSTLDEAYRALEEAGAPVRRSESTDAATGSRRDVVDAEIEGRAVQIAVADGGTSLDYSVENAR